MAAEKAIKFDALASGTELETPMGVGRFKAYKKGNFKKQNVQVEHAHGKLKWYTEDVLSLAVKKKTVMNTVLEVNQSAQKTAMLYYAL